MEKKKIDVKLLGEDGNAFNILARTTEALRKAGYTSEERESYYDEATSGDYNHLLAVTSEWVNII